jgi:RNA polymerase sigma-70 factor, ECF subfamily
MAREDPDETLMLRYQGGDVSAFEILLSRHERPVYNFLLRSVGNRSVAEDLLQDTFLRVIKGAPTYQRQAKFTTWLYTIARNLCVDRSRRQKHRKAQSLDQPLRDDDGSGTLLDVLPDSGPGSERQAIGHELRERLHAAIASLAEDQREVFLLRQFHDMPFKEIAEVVGIPENTAKSRMRYALEKLRLELEEYEDLARAQPG